MTRATSHSSASHTGAATAPPRDSGPAADTATPRGRRWAWLKVVAWASLLANIGIIGTGGAVRLTGSGLGCPTWPLCTPESLVPTQELSWHSIIEFGNRTLTGVLSVLAIAVVVLVWRYRAERRDLYRLAWIVLLGIIAQAVVGGVTVWTGLNPWVVGFHYVASVILACVATAFLVRYYEGNAPRERAVPKRFFMLMHITSVFVAISVIIGVLTTGAGPHSGDANVRRTGFDASLLAHLHSWPGYILLALVIAATIVAMMHTLRPRKQLIALLIALAVQIFLGVYQARNGLPAVPVGLHMVLAAVCASLMTWALLRMKQPVGAAPDVTPL